MEGLKRALIKNKYMETYNIEADENWTDKRVDKGLADYFDNYSRSFLKKLLDDGNILVNDKKAKPSLKIASGDRIDITIPSIASVEIEPEDIPLDIVYEDEDIIIVNKPKGMVVHPAAGHYSGTLVNALMYHCKDNLSGINGVSRPGIVHRIDMNTTGVLVTCKNDFAHSRIAAQLAVHDITRKYNAIVWNPFSVESGTVDAPLARSRKDRKKVAIDQSGRRAVTHYRVLASLKQDAHIRYVYTCQVLDIRFLEMMYMEAVNRHIILRGRHYMQESSDLFIQEQVNIWNLKHLYRIIFKRFLIILKATAGSNRRAYR